MDQNDNNKAIEKLIFMTTFRGVFQLSLCVVMFILEGVMLSYAGLAGMFSAPSAVLVSTTLAAYVAYEIRFNVLKNQVEQQKGAYAPKDRMAASCIMDSDPHRLFTIYSAEEILRIANNLPLPNHDAKKYPKFPWTTLMDSAVGTAFLRELAIQTNPNIKLYLTEIMNAGKYELPYSAAITILEYMGVAPFGNTNDERSRVLAKLSTCYENLRFYHGLEESYQIERPLLNKLERQRISMINQYQNYIGTIHDEVLSTTKAELATYGESVQSLQIVIAPTFRLQRKRKME